LARLTNSFAIGCSKLPRYFFMLFSQIETIISIFWIMSTFAFPLTPLYGIVGSSTQKYTILLFSKFFFFFEYLDVSI
jgi:hypothetical protein